MGADLNCPVCSGDSRVLKTEGQERRRACTRCDHRFSTIEKLRDEDRRQAAIIEDAKALAERIAAGA